MKATTHIFPENAPFPESPIPEESRSPQETGEQRIISNVPFRESSRKGASRPPRKVPNTERRSREYLTAEEVEQLQTATRRTGRHRHRDETLILIAYRHALRVSELVALRWDQIDMKAGLMHVRRRKNGTPSTHPIGGSELRALRRLAREYPESPYVFVSQRKSPLSCDAVRHIVERAGQVAGLSFPVHPHMLRHAAGFKLANDGQDTRAIQHFLGHKNINHTVRYTELSPKRFQNFFQD